MASLQPSDVVLLEVIGRELERARPETGEPLSSVLGMAAALLRTVGEGGAVATPARQRGLDLEALKTRLVAAGILEAGEEIHAERSSAGYSKDTFLVRVARQAGNALLVVRRDLPAGTTRTAVLDEYPVLKALHAEGLPVPEPLFAESDVSVLGQPFIVVRGMPGRIDFPDWQSDPAARIAAVRNLAGFLARLHTLEPTRIVGGAAVPGCSQAIRRYLAEWHALWRECRPAKGYQCIDEAYARMLETTPEYDGPARFVHGDVGFHNILIDGSEISAVLDWEFSHLGDPAEDISYCRPAVEALAPWDEFLDAYEAGGGAPCTQDRLDFCNLWRGVRNATCCAVGIDSFDRGLNSDLRLAYAGRVLIENFAADVRRELP